MLRSRGEAHAGFFFWNAKDFCCGTPFFSYGLCFMLPSLKTSGPSHGLFPLHGLTHASTPFVFRHPRTVTKGQTRCCLLRLPPLSSHPPHPYAPTTFPYFPSETDAEMHEHAPQNGRERPIRHFGMAKENEPTTRQPCFDGGLLSYSTPHTFCYSPRRHLRFGYCKTICIWCAMREPYRTQ